jgi:hypothetical protein
MISVCLSPCTKKIGRKNRLVTSSTSDAVEMKGISCQWLGEELESSLALLKISETKGKQDHPKLFIPDGGSDFLKHIRYLFIVREIRVNIFSKVDQNSFCLNCNFNFRWIIV